MLGHCLSGPFFLCRDINLSFTWVVDVDARGQYRTIEIPGRRIQAPMEPSGELWPNGEFTMGYAPGGGLESTLVLGPEEERSGEEHLDLAMLSNSHTDLAEVGKRRGQGGLTSRGARMVRNAAEAMEDVFGIEHLTFATMTLPSLTYEDFWNVSSNWAEIVRVFYQRLRRCLKKRGLSSAYIGVTELQPARTGREGIPALHLHFVFQGRSRGSRAWAIRPYMARAWWQDAVHLYCRGRYDFAHSENLQEVRESVAGYLSKYMSKGGDIPAPLLDNEMGWNLPTAWYNVSLKLKRYVSTHIQSAPELMKVIEQYWRAGFMDQACDYFYEGVIEECQGPGPHFCIGRLKDEALIEIRQLYRASVGLPP